MDNLQIDRVIKTLGVKNDTELATHLDKKRSAVGNWRALDKVPDKVLANVVEETGVSLDWLITGTEPMYRGAAVVQMDANWALVAMRIRDAYRNPPDEELAQKLGAGKRAHTIRLWDQGGTPIPEQYLNKCIADTGVSRAYLLHGPTGNLDVQGTTLGAGSINSDTNLVYVAESDDWRLAAGAGAYGQDHPLGVGKRAFSKTWMQQRGLVAEKCSVARVMGDSMEERLHNHDLILIDHQRTRVTEATPYAIRVEDSFYVKYLQQAGAELRLISHNKAYETFSLDMEKLGDSVEVIGAVVWHAHSWV